MTSAPNGIRCRMSDTPFSIQGGGAPQAKLVVEVDGDFHGDRMIEDRDRALWLDAQGYRVVRFAAVDVLVDLEAAVERLSLLLAPPPVRGRTSSPARGEGH